MFRRSKGWGIAALLLCSAIPAWGQDWTQRLPEGPGKETVASMCAGCHEFYSRVGNGYTADGWHTVIRMMINQGAPLPPDRVTVVTDYLIKSFPERPKPPAQEIPGPARIVIDAWTVPTPGSRPHDPLATRDGAIWYTGQLANVLGRIDPKTGAIEEFPLKTAHGGPHGLVEDQAGNIWYTGNAGSFIGKLEPRTGAVTEYPMLDPAAKDPHTLVFDGRRTIWFTVQGGNRIGRLDTKTGEIKLVTTPTPGARPYGIQINSKGVPFFVDFGTNKVGSIDPVTLAITEYPLPDPAARPRRLAIASDDVIWYTDYARGYLGRFDPATGKTAEWPSPSGPKSAPYGISAIHDVLWYSESEAKPNTVVRFDPKTAAFQSWIIPGGGNIVRNTSVTRDGNLVLANSLVNQVTLVTIK